MSNHQINFTGRTLFVISAIGFCLASIGGVWSMFGSVVFLVGCTIFMIPSVRRKK